MIIPITREIKITLLKWLKSGCIDTLDIPALHGDKYNLFLDLLMESDVIDAPVENDNKLTNDGTNANTH